MPEYPVNLTKREWMMGAEAGVTRNIVSQSENRGYDDAIDEEDLWRIHIEGACFEVALSKFLGRFWSPTVNTFSAADIGENIQARVRSKHWHDLLIRPRDLEKNPDHLFVLGTGLSPNFIIRGYIRCRDAQRDEWQKEFAGRPKTWFVPQNALLDVADLKSRIPNAATAA